MKREESFRRVFTAAKGKIVEEVSSGRLSKPTTTRGIIKADKGAGNEEKEKSDCIDTAIYTKLAR